MPIAIDFGTRSIHLVQGQGSKKSVLVRQTFIEQLPSGLMQDGIIREFGGLEMALKALLAKSHIRDRACIVTVNGNHIYNRELDVPSTKPKDMNNVISFEVQTSISSGKEVNVEYIVSKHKVLDKPDLIRVRASAMQLEYINDYHKLIKNCGLTPVALDIHPNALCKLLSDADVNEHPQTPGSSNMYLDMGAVTTTVYIITNGEITYSRIIPAGGIDIERYVNARNASSTESDKVDINSLDLSLTNLRSDESLGNAVRPLVTTINDNIQRIIQFLAGRLQNGRVDMIYLYGRTAIFNNFEKTLGEAFGIPTEVIRKVSKINMPDNIVISPFINAIGALIRQD